MAFPPVLDRVFVSLPRFSLRFLRTPAEAMQDFPNMGRMVGHAKVTSDQLCHPGTRPQVGFVPGRQGPSFQHRDQFLPLLVRQPRRFARMGLGGQAVQPSLVDRNFPPFHGGPRSAEELCNLGHLPTFEQQPPCDPSLSFQL
jgi:hypothetical protein